MSDIPKLRKRTPEELAELRRISALQHEVRMVAHSACDSIAPERSAAILEAVSRSDQQLIESLQNPIELHLVASNLNGDDGVASLLQIVEHPYCDAGTALWLYWDNDPYYYASFRSLEDVDEGEERSMLTLSRTIEDRFFRGDFRSSVVQFDPHYWLNANDAPRSSHEIPDIMSQPILHRR